MMLFPYATQLNISNRMRPNATKIPQCLGIDTTKKRLDEIR